MDDAVAMGFVEGVGDLNAVAQDLGRRQRALGECLGQRLAFEILHDDVVDAILRADVVERADVGMVQAGDGAGLALEALAACGVGGEECGQHLDGDGTVQPRVLGPVHLTHTAGPDRGGDLVGTQTGSGGEGHKLSRLRPGL